MLGNALIALLGVTGMMAAQVVAVTVLVSITILALRLDRRVSVFSIAHFFYDLRWTDYLNRGALPVSRRLRRRVRREAKRFLERIAHETSTDYPWFAWSARFAGANRAFENKPAVDAAIAEIWPDLSAHHEELRRILPRFKDPLEKRFRWHVRVWTTIWALACAAAFQVNIPEIFDRLMQDPNALWLELRYLGFDLHGYWTLDAPDYLFGVLATTLLTTGAVGMGQHILERRHAPAGLRQSTRPADSAHSISDEKDAASSNGLNNNVHKIGHPGRAIRVLNFAGGGFDTIMQLGVTHALTVLQGRAPDAVVGLSAGALQATVVAEVLQAGEAQEAQVFKEVGISSTSPADQWSRIQSPETRKRIQEIRILARAEKLRSYIDASQRAPGELFDALMPDTLQIDSHEPLKPLEQPRFPQSEREERENAAISRSGLVRLYNDLLSVHLSISTITRFVRRVLGIIAAREIEHRGARFFIRSTEFLRFWILLGLNLHRVAPLLPIFVRPVFMKPRRAVARTAGALLFKFEPVVVAYRVLGNFVSFVALLTAWVGLSLLPIAPVYVHPLWGTVLICGTVLVPLSYFGRKLSQFNRTTLLYEVWEAVKGLLIYSWVTTMWLGVFVAIIAIPTAFLFYLWTNPLPLSYIDTLVRVACVLWAVAIFFFVAVFMTVLRSDTPYLDRLLGAYHLSTSLFQADGLKAYLIELFDPDYYGKPEMDNVVRDSLDNETKGTRRKANPKKIGYYSCKNRREPIEVGLAVTDVVTGELDVVSPSENVVDGLLAAVSVTPFFPPQTLNGKICIDGANISNEPTRALMSLLRNRIEEDAPVVQIYSVSPFPVSQRPVGDTENRDEVYLNLVDVIFRALSLQRIRDATVERRLTELFTRIIPPGLLEVSTSSDRNDEAEKCFRAWVTPIELDTPTSLNKRILQAPKEQRRKAIAESIAEGCRAAMQVMIANTISDMPPESEEKSSNNDGQNLRVTATRFVQCAEAVGRHFESREIPVELKNLSIAGRHRAGPGLNEICKHCALKRAGEEKPFANQGLRVENWDDRGPSWPHEREYRNDDLENDPHFVRNNDLSEKKAMDGLESLKRHNESVPEEKYWPRPRKNGPGQERATVSFLFSGGVFRGVFQMGVLNGLSEIGLRPDLIAGASVGSITAAMVARTFSLGPKSKVEVGTQIRARIARLAAIYLAVDRLIVTDRFADFIRNLTLRAGDTRFSIRQADRFFRKYDYPGFREFDHNARKVLAGIERLLYINPYQLNALVRAFRHGEVKTVAKNLKAHVQQWLDRMQVGLEVLGAEPLQDLIEHYVMSSIEGRHPSGPTFDDIRESTGVHFLATATNLSRGRLEVLGEKPVFNGDGAAMLREGLLTSSAFPGVFRPRWSWELFPDSSEEDQYIDGGVTDNLPIDAVAQFLKRAASEKIALVAQRPVHPHLVVAASLQVDSGPRGVVDTEALKTSWPTLLSRAKELSYNIKLDRYASAEQKLRNVSRNSGHTGTKPVDIEIVAVKPEWLCGTFAFHPMTGFQRKKQARSIAHGCASTLLRFARIKTESGEDLLEGWGVNPESVPDVTKWAEAFEQWANYRRQGSLATDSKCWLRPEKVCPFSLKELANRDLQLPERTQHELNVIHQECPHHHTHLRKF